MAFIASRTTLTMCRNTPSISKNSLTLGDSEFCIDAVCNAISKVVNDGDKLSIYGFGTFQKVRRKPKPYRHPVTGEMCVPEPSDVIKFVPGVAFFPSTEPDYADL